MGYREVGEEMGFMSLKNKIIIFFTFAIIFSVVLLSSNMFFATNRVIEESEQNLKVVLTNSISDEIQDNLDFTEANVKAVVINENVKKLFAKRDRKGLIKYLSPMYEGLKTNFSQAHFHLPDSVSFLRLHKPDKFGDSLKSFRFTVNTANEQKKMVKGIEEGVSGFGFRVVMPITYDGVHLGTFEYGREFENDFLKSLKDSYGGEFSLYKFDENKNPVYISSTTNKEEVYDDTKSLEKLTQGTSVHTRTKDKKYNNYMVPFASYDGKIIGFIKCTMDRSHIINKNNIVIRNTLFFILITLSIIIFSSFLFLTKSFKPLYLLMQDANEISKGDFTRNISYSKDDEIGLIGKSFENISSNLRNMLSSIGDMSYNVANTSQMLSASSEQITASNEEVNKNVIDVSIIASNQLEAVESAKEYMNFMADKISQLNNSVKSINKSMNSVIKSTNDGTKASSMIEDKISNLKLTSVKTTENINKLGKNSKEIEDIVTTIQSIASETNLLALNASIEAARAGESGKGFSVVANEVGKLAEESRNSTSQIDTLIKEIQSNISLVVSSMDESNQKLEEGIDVVSSSNEKFKDIENEVRLAVNQISDITNLVENIYIKIDDVLKSFKDIVDKSNETMNHISSVKNISNEQTLAMNEITNSTINLAGLSSDLKDAISKFKY